MVATEPYRSTANVFAELTFSLFDVLVAERCGGQGRLEPVSRRRPLEMHTTNRIVLGLRS